MEPDKLEALAHRHSEIPAPVEEPPDAETEQFLSALVSIFQWVVPDNKITAAGIAARAMTVARALNISESRGVSMWAQADRLGVSRELLSQLLDEFSEQWGLTVPTGKSKASREIFRRSRIAAVESGRTGEQGDLFARHTK